MARRSRSRSRSGSGALGTGTIALIAAAGVGVLLFARSASARSIPPLPGSPGYNMLTPAQRAAAQAYYAQRVPGQYAGAAPTLGQQVGLWLTAGKSVAEITATLYQWASRPGEALTTVSGQLQPVDPGSFDPFSLPAVEDYSLDLDWGQWGAEQFDPASFDLEGAWGDWGAMEPDALDPGWFDLDAGAWDAVPEFDFGSGFDLDFGSGFDLGGGSFDFDWGSGFDLGADIGSGFDVAF